VGLGRPLLIDPSGALRDEEPQPEPERSPGRSEPAAADRVPRIVEGVELIGKYRDSGFKETPYLARRSDGQVIQLSRLLFAVAEKIDGRRPIGRIAPEVGRGQDRALSPENVEFLIVNKLVPLGIASLDGVPGPRLKRFDPMLALKFKMAVVPEGLVQAVATVFKPLFFPPVVVAILLSLVALDVWVFFAHGIAQSFRELLLHPTTMLVVMGLIVLSAAFHECGHATACRYGGARPGVIGAGIYIVWPAFYSDVTDAYRLGKGARLRTDLGGVYFNVVFMLAVAGLYFLTHFEPLLILVFAQHLEIAHQFLPFLRLDGYYVVADITGVPDLFGRIKPILAHLLLRRPAEKTVTELKPWVRRVVTGWVLLTVPIVAYIYVMLIVHAPRILGTAWASISTLGAGAMRAAGHGDPLGVLIAAVQILLLGLPTVGLIASFAMSGKQLGAYVWKNTEGRPLRRSLAMCIGAMLATLLVLSWTPPAANYRPIQPGERGTVQAAVIDTLPPPLRQAIPRSLGAPLPLPDVSPATATGATPSPGAGASPDASPDATPSASPAASPTDQASPPPSP
jgi:putative peptide zinc metalloprotease protein